MSAVSPATKPGSPATKPVTLERRSLLSAIRPSRAILNIVLVVSAVFWLVPTIGLAIISLRPESLFQQSGWWTALTAPSQLTLSNYQTLFAQGLVARGVLDSLLTSLEITVPATLLVTIISSLTAYSLVFGRWPGRSVVFLVIVGLLVVPIQVALIPVVQEYRVFGDLSGFNPFGTIPGVVIFHVAFGLPFGIFLMYNFYSGIPKEMLEAGRIDGAGELRIFTTVIVPLLKPIVATLAVFSFLGTWNDFMWPLIVLTDDSLHTLPVALAGLSREHVQDNELMMAGSVVTVLPVLLLFLALQRQYMDGLLAGSIKG